MNPCLSFFVGKHICTSIRLAKINRHVREQNRTHSIKWKSFCQFITDNVRNTTRHTRGIAGRLPVHERFSFEWTARTLACVVPRGRDHPWFSPSHRAQVHARHQVMPDWNFSCVRMFEQPNRHGSICQLGKIDKPDWTEKKTRSLIPCKIRCCKG